MKRVVILADPGQSDASTSELGQADGWPRVRNHQLPIKYYDAPNPARVCFWSKIRFVNIDSINTEIARPVIYSVAEFPRSDQIFRDTGLLIVNWDAANGDPLYRADATLTYLSTRGRVPIKRFLNGGGVVLIESQTAQSRPVQESYDSIFDSREVTVGSVPKDEVAAGTQAHILDGARGHPLFEGFDKASLEFEPTVSTASDIFVNVPEELITRSGAPGPRGRDGDISKNLWYGWFTHWGSDWMPLLYNRLANDDRYPVLLSKVCGNGLVLLSTIWLSVAHHRLSSRIVEVALSPELIMEAIKAQKRAILKRRAGDLVIGLMLSSMLLLATLGVVVVARSTEQNWILATLGIGAIGLTTLMWKIFLKVYHRPLGVPFFKAYGPKTRLIGKRG